MTVACMFYAGLAAVLKKFISFAFKNAEQVS